MYSTKPLISSILFVNTDTKATLEGVKRGEEQ